MYFLTYHGQPVKKSNSENIAGAFINCYVDEDEFDIADKIARNQIKKLKWKLLSREDAYKIDENSVSESGREYYEQARIDKTVCVFHTYPEIEEIETKKNDTAVFTTKFVLKNKKTITYVSHDIEDGAWQFFSNDKFEDYESVARVAGFKEMFQIDPSLNLLSDLELGFCAVRRNKRDIWQIKRIE